MPKSKPSSPAEQALRSRIQQLAERHSISELARRTGAGLSNVSRYLMGTRIPGEFCVELIRQFGVNPSWLMAGEGQPFVADITAGTVKMAGDVLELVEAMNAVAEMRLGALTGKHHLRVLRELNEALRRFEGLRQTLNQRSAPIFGQLLDDLQKALDGQHIEQALELRKAATQVERLCNEPELSRRFTRLKAHLAMFEQDAQAAVNLQQDLVRESLAEGRLVSADECEDFLRLAMVLRNIGRRADALRVFRAFTVLADKQAESWPGYANLRFFEGNLLAEIGRMREGMALMMRWKPPTTGRSAEVAQSLMTAHMVGAGVIAARDALAVGANTEAKLLTLAQIGVWTEDIVFLDEMLAMVDRGGFQVLPGLLPPVEIARHILNALRGREKTGAERLRQAFEKTMPPAVKQPSSLDDHCAQVALIAGDAKEAARWQERARQYHARPEVREDINVISRAVFLRNELRLDPKSKEAEAAREELQGYVADGYWLLRSALIE